MAEETKRRRSFKFFGRTSQPILTTAEAFHIGINEAELVAWTRVAAITEYARLHHRRQFLARVEYRIVPGD